MWFLLFVGLLVILFLISQVLTKGLSQLFLLLFHSNSAAVYVLSFLFLPGVILHELSHLLMASILFVPTGEIEFLPEVHGSEVKMGSVAIAHTDPIRRFLIGVAPIMGGIGVFLLIASYLLHNIVLWKEILLLYSSFEIANTMFSSRKDLEGAVELLLGILVVCFILQTLGLPIISFLTQLFQGNVFNAFFLKVSQLVSIALGIDIFIILLTKGLLALQIKHQ